PNPVYNDLYIVNPGFTFDRMHVEILNSSGLKVLDSYLSSPDKSVNVQCLTGGFYLVKLVSGSEVYYSKFVKN
nr:T9SS type A sorting domain-containing protein [Bacteroidota bacterium]